MTDNDRRYFIRLIELIRDATQRCSKASEDWNRANDEFNDWYWRQFPERMAKRRLGFPNVEEPGPIDPLHYVKVKKENLALNDAEANWSHWEREVVRLTAALQAEATIRQLLNEPATHHAIPTQGKGWAHAER